MRRFLPGMAALGALVITAPAQASFAPEGSPLAVGAAQPYGVLTADFNRDGRTDAATVNGTGSNLSVFLRGPAGFATEAGSPFPTGLGPGYGFVADFNGDGYPDVATQNFSDGTVSVLIRQPGGGFVAGTPLSVGSTGSVTAGDFNGDGRVDIAAPSYNGNTVVTYLGNGSGGFTQEGPANATGATPRDIVAADFNGDTRPDLAISNLNGGSVTVLLRNAANNGFASEAAAIPVGASPEGIEAADFNGDGLADIAVAVLGTNTVNVLLRNPGGGFTAEAPIPVGAGALGLATADLNADGRPDLAVTSNSAGTVTVLLRQAGGGFAADGAPLAAPGANGVAAGDFNGDGKPDLAASNDQANTLSVFLNTTTPAAPAPPAPPAPGKSVVVRVVSGTVTIKYPAGQAPAGTGNGFVPLTGALNIPMGSQLDTTKGRVALTSAADTAGKKTQTADFYQGIFQVKQSVPKKKPKKPAALITDLVMKGQIARSQCAPLKGARAAGADKKKGPKSVFGKLWGNGKGKFRTDGKYSSATVRGTIWLVQDRCDGTLTKVTRGTVQVRDFKRKKTVSVKAGHTYLARAARAAAKSKR
ncbi:MAG: FG-GAP repeat domain-containing protein [Solirubrobacteraceae bacterium]